ncbi:MAG TPA: alpha-amylase family glycosyl hydrolase [Chloroflexota bacterium]
MLAGETGASFRVWAPHASAVELRLAPAEGQPSESFQLEPDAAPGYWSADISGVTAGHRYCFHIMNSGLGLYNPGGPPRPHVDPCARQVTSSDPAGGLGIVVDPARFRFSGPFQTPGFQDFIIYQAHVGSFAGLNDGLQVRTDASGGTATFEQFASKLDYIRGLNFNAVQFLPTGEYRGSEGEAYNPSDYYAPEELYGDPDQLRSLIDACHARGLAVFFDVVYNHMDVQHNLWQFDGNTDHRPPDQAANEAAGGGIYFSTWETGFGRRPDHDSPDVQRFFRENAEMWFSEYHVDGLRFDSAANISEAGLEAIVQPVLASFPDKFIYAEHTDPGYVFGEIGFRACWVLSSPSAFASVVAQRDFAGLQDLIGRWGYPTAYSAIKYLLGSHDQIFNGWAGDHWDKGPNRYFVELIGGPVTGRDNWVARAQARLGWALNVAMPCAPLLFMGSECLHHGYWNPANDLYGDHRFDWALTRDGIGLQMQALVRDANAVRWANPALRNDLGPQWTHLDPDNKVLAFRRWNDEGNVVLVVVNLSDSQWPDANYRLNVGRAGDHWQEIFNSQAPQYGGWNDSGNGPVELQVEGDGRFNIRLPQWSVLMFRQV